MILEQHPELMQHHLSGGAIPWAKIWKGIKDTASFVSKAAPVAAQLAGPEYSDTIGKVGDISGKISGLGRPKAPRITNKIKQMILQQHPELMEHHLAGGKIDFKKLWNQIKSVGSFVSKAAPIAAQIAGPEYSDSINRVGDISGKISGLGRGGNFAHMAAIDLARRAMSKKKGAGFWKDFGHGFVQGLKGTAKIAAPALGVASIFQPELLPLAAATGVASKALGNGRMSMHRAKSVGHAKNQARGAIIRQLMREHGMSLGQASSYIKQHNIPF